MEDSIYPYKSYYLDVFSLINKSVKYKPVIVNRLTGYNDYKYLKKYKNGYLFIVTDFNSKFNDINAITDFFSEYSRVKNCRLEADSISSYDYFNMYKLQIIDYVREKYGKVDFETLNRFMEFGNKSALVDLPSKPSVCTNYKLTYLLGILQHFKPKRWLDMSAGWGDRLIAAYLYGVDYYYGIDPNENNFEAYNEIVKFFEENSDTKTKVKLHKGPAEDAMINYKETFDFIFTSPPFFTFEIYDEKNKNQSVNKYNSIKAWLENFLYVTIDKGWKRLSKNGNFAMYIEDKKEYRFIPELLKYMENKEDCVYDGVIYQAAKDDRYPKKPYKLHTVYCFRKL